jgi:hypothetical protein
MKYFRDSKVKYETEYVHAWRLNDDDTVDYRDVLDEDWSPALVIPTGYHLENSLMRGDIEEIGYNPFDISPVQKRALEPLDPDLRERALDTLKEYDCPNDH